jgi:hypothetical protein
MSDRRTLDDATLDRLLTDAATAIAWPATPPLHLRARRARRPVVRRALFVAIAALLLTAGAALAAGALGIGPLRILFSDALPSPNVSDTPLATRLALGTRTAIDDPTIKVALLEPGELGPPDEVYRSIDGRQVSLVWGARDGLPATSGSRIGLLAMFLSGNIEPELIQKIVIESRVTIQRVTVRGHPGYWISGAPHVLHYNATVGDGLERTRLVGDVLVWDEGVTVVRLESGLGRDASIALAETMRTP